MFNVVRSTAARSTRSVLYAPMRMYATPPTPSSNSQAQQTKEDGANAVGEGMKKVGKALQSDGSVGKNFNADGAVGSKAEAVGGPFSKDGVVGKQFTDKGAIGGTGQAVAEELEKAGKETKQ